MNRVATTQRDECFHRNLPPRRQDGSGSHRVLPLGEQEPITTRLVRNLRDELEDPVMQEPN